MQDQSQEKRVYPVFPSLLGDLRPDLTGREDCTQGDIGNPAPWE